jgi:hypothetical protein
MTRKRKLPPCFDLLGGPVTADEYAAAKLWLWVAIFPHEEITGMTDTVWQEWLSLTPEERRPALEEARTNEMRGLAAYFGTLHDARKRQEQGESK